MRAPGRGDFAHSIPTISKAVDENFRAGRFVFGIWGTSVLVDALVDRGTEADLLAAQHVIDNLASLPQDMSGVMRDIWLLRLRARVAQAGGDDLACRELRQQHHALATSLGFEGHMRWSAGTSGNP